MPTTIGVLSVLEGALRDEAKRLWARFESEYGSRGVQTFDHPNVTFQAGLCGDTARLTGALADLSRDLTAFDIVVDGLGYFDAPAKVVFLRVQLTEELPQINRAVNDVLAGCCERVFDHYVPDRWTPHVTVAMDDLTDVQFKRAMRDLKGYHPYFGHEVSSIQLVQRCDQTGRIEIVESYACDGGRRLTSD